MKKKSAIIAGAVLSSLLATGVSADFEKSKTYNDGQFTDVPASEWYASSVKDAYEYGIMNGDSAVTFNPIGTLTVAEGITIASRINETLTGVKIPEAQGEWYTKYVNYAIANGIMSADEFDSYDVNIKRYEIAKLLANVCGELPAVNNVTALPDVALGADYADEVLKLYNGGILTGNDSYGTFSPNSYLLRSEISAMAVRIADSSKRVQKTFDNVDARAFTDSYHMIDMYYSTGLANGLSNGWNYDNRFNLFNKTGIDHTGVQDKSAEHFFGFYRDFDTENEGILSLEMMTVLSSSDNGAYVSFQNSKQEDIFKITAKNGVLVLVGETEAPTSVAISETESAYYTFKIDIDLDKNTASAIINNTVCGSVPVKESELSRLALGTTKEGNGSVNLVHTVLAKNYISNDRFVIFDNNAAEKPAGWNISGDFKLEKTMGVLGSDLYSVKSETKACAVSTASKTFEKATGKLVFETNLLLPIKTDGASVSFTSDGKDVFKFETKNGNIVMGDNVLHNYTENVWQHLYVEADTVTGKATLKINGKKRAEISFTEKTFDGVSISFAPDKDAVMWFDDVLVYPLVDHADYPSYPAVAESTDYNVGINVCWLWRDGQSGEGWDSVSSFPEFDTYMGFYDEGLRETADWELKWMAEHGIDFMHVCWYCPHGVQNAPIKKMKTSHAALHDGYMNAKYSDLVDFCIMWENGGGNVQSFEQFKEYIWKYWKEYYFSDDRYVRLDNKAVLTVWYTDTFINSFGGAEGAKAAVEFMNEDIKSLGYDGIILLFATQGANTSGTYTKLASLGGAGTYGYHWGEQGYKADHQIMCNTVNAEASSGIGHNIPTISIGFNDVGRNQSRSPIITGEDHLEVCENAKEILSKYNTGTWMDNTVMISTWNEFSEGTYVLPTESNGFDYLENIRKVFTNDTSDHSALDVRLTPTQTDRVGHMYPANHSPVRHLQFEEAESTKPVITTDEYIAVRSYDMGVEADAAVWEAQFGISDYTNEGVVIKGTASGSDYAIKTVNSFEQFNSDNVQIIHIRAKAPALSQMEIYFTTSSDSTWGGRKYKAVDIEKAGEFVDYYIDMSGLDAWQNNIRAVRIDPCTAPGTFEISLIEFMSKPVKEELDVPGVYVNGEKLSFTFLTKALTDGDTELVGEARNKGFYSALRLYHEWDRFTGDGVLTLKTYDENTYVFTVGSDKVLVNGTEKPLGFNFSLRDGLPVFHIKKLCDLIGYKYTVKDDDIYIQATDDKTYEILSTRVENEWEFKIPEITEGWSLQQATGSVTDDGMLTIYPSGIDVAVANTTYSYNAKDYNRMAVGAVYDKTMDTEKPYAFFRTSASNSWSADKYIGGTYITEGKKYGDIIEVVFELDKNAKYTGTITGLRFDPYDFKSDVVKIDYIRLYKEGTEAIKKNLTEVTDMSNLFDADGNTEGWSTHGGTIATVADGYLLGTPEQTDNGLIRSINFDCQKAQVVIVGVKYNPEYCHEGTLSEMFFTTTAFGSMSGDKSVKGKWNIHENPKFYENVEIIFDLSESSKFYGSVTGLRLDPHEMTIPFEIDYIKYYSKNGYVAPEPPEIKINKTTKPTTVHIDDVNEIPEGITVECFGASKLNIVEDPVEKGKDVFMVECVADGDQYTYMNINMQFTAGKTYNISYKIYPLKNKNGEDFTNTCIGSNFIYGSDGNTTKDHTLDGAATKSSGDGWITRNLTYTVEPDYNPTEKDYFQFWGKFSGGAGVNYLVKDIVIQ